MEQQIVISTEIVNYLSENLPAYRKNTALELIEIIEQNYVVSDKATHHFNKIIDEVDKIVDSAKKSEIFKIIQYWINNKNCFIDCNNTSMDDDILLTSYTNDRIYLNPIYTNKEKQKKTIKYSDIEIHNSESFIKPLCSDRLKNAPDILKLEKDVYYDIERIFQPYLKNAGILEIIDPFLPNPNALYNFKKIINLSGAKQIKVIIHSQHNYIEKYGNRNKEKAQEDYESLKKFLADLKKVGKKVQETEFKLRSHKERYIKTEKLKIKLPGGLDFLNKDGFAKIEIGEEPLEIEIGLII